MLQDVEVSRMQSRSRRWLLVTAGAIVTAAAAALAMDGQDRAPAPEGSGAAGVVRPASSA